MKYADLSNCTIGIEITDNGIDKSYSFLHFFVLVLVEVYSGDNII